MSLIKNTGAETEIWEIGESKESFSIITKQLIKFNIRYKDSKIQLYMLKSIAKKPTLIFEVEDPTI